MMPPRLTPRPRPGSGIVSPRRAVAAVALGAVASWSALAGPAGGAVDVAAAPPAPACVAAPVRIDARAAPAADAADACTGARAAIDFLARHGATTNEPIGIAIVDTLPDIVGATAAGCFVPSERRVYLLSYAAFRAKHKDWFGLPIDRHLYRSLAAHEVAHALMSCSRAGPPPPTIQATEYVAYVTMFATMDDARRRRALANLPGSGFADASRITPIVYLFDPMRFGAEAYRHYLRHADGAAFLRAVLAGAALAD